MTKGHDTTRNATHTPEVRTPSPNPQAIHPSLHVQPPTHPKSYPHHSYLLPKPVLHHEFRAFRQADLSRALGIPFRFRFRGCARAAQEAEGFDHSAPAEEETLRVQWDLATGRRPRFGRSGPTDRGPLALWLAEMLSTPKGEREHVEVNFTLSPQTNTKKKKDNKQQ